ncbi:hypothetical protein P8452_21701 [Trifolium repens]|jgi:hypothetical protein|nr:hypothetical protein P8452_21701 [Trifolium repens]
MDIFDILGKEGSVPVPYQTPYITYKLQPKGHNSNHKETSLWGSYYHGTLGPEFHCSRSELKEIKLYLNYDRTEYINCTCGQTFQ